MKIIKAKESMSAKERVQRTFAYEKVDRVTIGYNGNANIDKQLTRALGAKDIGETLDLLGVDYYSVSAPYVGRRLFMAPEGRRVDALEGAVMRWVEHGSGGYWDYCDFPLKAAAEEAFYSYPVPNPDDFDYDAALIRAKNLSKQQYAVYAGSAGTPDIINSNGRIMGMEDVLCHLLTGDEAAIHLIHRRAYSQLEVLERLLDKCRGYIDFVWLGEDMGTQIGPMVSHALYERTMKPIHKAFAQLACSFNLPSIMHTCGSSSWAYEHLIEIGIKGVDSLQPEATDMSPAHLTERFGGRLNFRGLVSTTGVLSFGNPEQVEAMCRETLSIMMPCGGYHFAPSHNIQDNTPVKNVIAMYQAAHTYGSYL